MNNRTILDKLGSRKLWVTIIGVIIGVAMAFGVEGSEYTEIAGLVSGSITAVLSIVSYITGEAKIDAAASVPINIDMGIVEKTEPENTENDGENTVVQ
ncbi:MAG: hypothetical protein IKI93_17580 [Clostridia bacterium]|nr:hypothetical protein [Clostridia bacterium]